MAAPSTPAPFSTVAIIDHGDGDLPLFPFETIRHTLEHEARRLTRELNELFGGAEVSQCDTWEGDDDEGEDRTPGGRGDAAAGRPGRGPGNHDRGGPASWVEDPRDGQLDDSEAAKDLANAIRKQKARTREFYRRAGATQEITLLGTDRGVSTYLVRFESVLTIMRFARNEEG